INYDRIFDKLTGEFKTSYCENPTIYTGSEQQKPLINHASIYFKFADYALGKFDSRRVQTIPGTEKDTLRIIEDIFKKAFIFSMNSKFSPITTLQAANGLKKIYSLLGKEETATDFCDSLLSITNTPSLHLLRAEMLSFRAKAEGNNPKTMEEAKKEFLSLLDKEDFRHLGYRGLIELYSISGNDEKIKEIILDTRNEPELLDQIILFSIRFDPEGAIELLENWKEIYPRETTDADPLIKKLKKGL
ncbi:MAG: hypothetical protein P8Y62_07160, partial [candidate division WOR-3 bacterium]